MNKEYEELELEPVYWSTCGYTKIGNSFLKIIPSNIKLGSYGDYCISIERISSKSITRETFDKVAGLLGYYDTDEIPKKINNWYEFTEHLIIFLCDRKEKPINGKNAVYNFMENIIKFNELLNIYVTCNDGNSKVITAETKDYFYVFSSQSS